MSIIGRERGKITFLTVIISLGIIIIFWTCLFVTDYIMYKNNMPCVFSKTYVEDTKQGHKIYECGLFYYVLTNESGTKEMYLFENYVK